MDPSSEHLDVNIKTRQIKRATAGRSYAERKIVGHRCYERGNMTNEGRGFNWEEWKRESIT